MNQPREMITFSLGYKRRAPFLGLNQTQSSSEGVLSAINQVKQTPRKERTALRSLRTTSSRKMSLSSNSPKTDQVMNRRQGKKVSGGCGDKEDLSCFGWTKYGSRSNAYTYHRRWASISGPLALPRHVRIFLRPHKNYVVMCASFVILSDILIGAQFQVIRQISSNTPSETNVSKGLATGADGQKV